ncbi:hypothetical protein [Saliterribacillus persicus]|uniref:Uncharacterized protein n=1 Tax=Saliterribacillus persicus TaxID=930114 RepID=A0A368X6Z9_9BACI|nr:hypothetical protein [Saliterribacillus persicus]RCW62966.1 hypothetical protein DFR57_1213 [Saliterribacillus persicus]
MSTNTFQIDLDSEVLRLLRDKVNEEQNIIFNKRNKAHRAWDKICAIMDRLDDTVEYLNGLKLNTGKYKNSSFDFFDFMNNASVVVDCIKKLSKIFDVSNDKMKKSIDIFNQTGKDGKGTDEKYFEYLRSLCSIHPVETSHHIRYQDNDFECSPFVLWNNRKGWINNDYDLSAVVYTSNDEDYVKRVQIYISQIFDYVKTRLEFVQEIIKSIDDYQKKVIADFQKKTIKKEQEFDNYIAYLRNINIEKIARYGSESAFSFDYIIDLFEIKLSNPKNQEKMNLYLNIFKYAIEFEHNSIQNMSDRGFENNGLIHSEKKLESTLYSELYSPHSGSHELREYSYNLQKINYLKYDSGFQNKQWAHIQIKEMLPFLERYVSFKGVNDDFEHYVLVQLALYLDSLENKCFLNMNIPNDLKYRERVLSDKEWKDLFTEK